MVSFRHPQSTSEDDAAWEEWKRIAPALARKFSPPRGIMPGETLTLRVNFDRTGDRGADVGKDNYMQIVAWRVKDFADGWMLYDNEQTARCVAERHGGALVEPLYRLMRKSETE